MTKPKMERIHTDKVAEPEPGLWSNCKRIGDWVFVSGFVALNAKGEIVGPNDPGAQARFVFSNIKHYFEAAGGKMNDIVKLQIYLTDMRHRPPVLDARRQFFTGDFPCSTLVGVTSLFDTRALVEIDCIGHIGAGV